MKIVATSDIHGQLPKISECDLYIIAGDVCPIICDQDLPRSTDWLRNKFMPYLRQVPAKDTVWIAGNHDFVLEHYPWITNDLRRMGKGDGKAFYLQDEELWYSGVTIYGTPWTPHLPRWAFPAEGEKAEEIYKGIPDDLDILISHGPPHGYSDRVSWAGHVGSDELLAVCKEKKPKRVICGHIHEGFGTYPADWGTVYNVSHNNEYYEPVNAPIEITVEPAQ